MPTAGLEPARRFQLRILSPLRLPFRQAGAEGCFTVQPPHRPDPWWGVNCNAATSGQPKPNGRPEADQRKFFWLVR